MDFSSDQPRPDQKSLVMAFDTTGSMGSELEQVKSSAQEIVQEMAAKAESPIYNYILVAFNNPNVDEAVITRNKDDALNNIKQIGIQSKYGHGCAEMAMLGLKKGLTAALPNSIVYVFTDASAADLHLLSEVEDLIRKKQITVNFLLTGDCGEKHTEKYQVYFKISRVSGGQVYEIERSNVKSVFMPIKEDLSPNFVVLKTIKTESAETKNINFDVDISLEQLKVSVIGSSPTLSIYDPSNNLVTGSSELSLGSLKLSTVKSPKQGKWRIVTYASSAYTIVISGMSSLKFNFGFSLKPADSLSQTNLQPLSGFKNILSISVSNMAQVKELSSVEIVTVPLSSSETSTTINVPLKHQKGNIFASDPFDVPNQTFTIKLNGPDSDGNVIERAFPSPIVATSGSAPELSIKADKVQAFETGSIELSCIVKSQIPVEIGWTLNGKILEKIESSESNELKLNIKNAKLKDSGVYKCVTINKVNCETQEIKIDVLAAPNIKIISSSAKMVENSSYTLTCQLDDTKGQIIDYSWVDKDDNVLQKSGQTYTFTAKLEQDKQLVKCKAKCKAFELEDSLILDVDYSPRFLKDESSLNNLKYGSSVSFDCTTVEKPSKNPVKWFFKGKDSTEKKLIDGQNEGTLKIEKLSGNNAGEYECAVSNTVGEVKRNFNVTLGPKGIPKITTASKVIVKNVTESVEFYCECNDCLPITHAVWYVETKSTETRSYLMETIKDEEKDYYKTFVKVDEVSIEDSPFFKCTLENELGQDTLKIELQIQKPPKIEKILLKSDIEIEIKESFEILEGENMTIECVADGLPIPEISWNKGGKSILNIPNVAITDEGDFECEATNLLGAVRKTVHLDVNFPPRREKDVETAFTVVEKKKVTLDCNLIGKPDPEITWQFNSKLIEANDKFEIVGKTLNFVAGPDDSGIYGCVGVNAFGNASVEFSGIVKTFPRIFKSSDEIVKVENNTFLELPCDATAYPQPSIKFLLNNTELINTSPLLIKSVTPSDAGNYHCIAENEVGTDEKIFYVYVVKKPMITTCLPNITLYTNQTEEISCGAVGLPEPSIKWKYNDVDILSTNELLTLSSTQNSGKVSCIAENSEGNDEKHFYLETINIPNLLPIAKDLQTNITIREGYDLDLLCPFENYNIIDWTFNDTALKAADFKKADKKLIIFNVERSFSGLWTCLASNTEGNKTFSFNVKVLAAPKVLASWNFNKNISDFENNKINLDERHFKMEDNLTMNCTVDGSPLPNVEWRKGIDLIGRGEVLSINKLQFHHSDIYTCSAENTQGVILKYFKVDVRSAPYVDKSVDIQTKFLSYIDDTEILRCSSIHGNPKPLFIWLVDNELIEDAVDDHLVIDKIKLSDQGKYTCIGRNELGSAKINYILDVYEPAQILRAVEEERISKDDKSVKLSCTVRANPLPIVSWTFNGHIYTTTSRVKIDEVFTNLTGNVVYFDKFGNGINFLDPFKLSTSSEKYYSMLTKIDSKTLKLDMIYKNPKDLLHQRQFNCYTFNALGRDEKSVNINVTQKPYIEKENMIKQKDVEILEHMPMELHCLVEGYPKPQVKWFKDGHEIYNNETIKFIDNRRILTLSETLMWDSGSYKCLAENVDGKLEIIFNVVILSPPKITEPKQ
ncbi:hemicentin-2-like [Chironomus tepperi]|uniref:hemicentin-2-like n=1 Tax=Chironomus tepperi TaxID=113505 RepID=UPI00391FB99D